MAANKKIWHRVNAPVPWRPKIDDELIGEYLSTEHRSGQFGEYRVYYVRSHNKTYYVSGSMLNDLFSLLDEGMEVRLVYKGSKENKEGHTYKLYEVYTQEEVEFKIADMMSA